MSRFYLFGVLCSIVITLLAYLSLPNRYLIVVLVLAISVVLQVFGGIYSILKQSWIAYLGMLGFVLFLPIGLFGMVGLSKMMDAHNSTIFRRRLVDELGADSVSTYPTKTFRIERANLSVAMTIGFVCLSLSIAIPVFMIVPIVMVIKYIASINFDLMRVFDTHMELKGAPGLNKVFIRKGKIISFTPSDSKLTYLDESDEVKTRKFYIEAFEENKQQELNKIFSEFTSPNVKEA